MATSLPPDVALYHMDAKVFQRSKGRSSVAAAAYRSTSCLTDQRIGETFDYTRKHKVAAFIITPENAPDWTRDRESLWNACEAVERANGVVGREVEIAIPRDIPESEWQTFAEEIVARYIEAGAVVDVAIHAPTAADKNPNPHIHAMMTTRALDDSRPHGFAAKKNDSLIQIFESGGRHGGGKRGDALRAERERIADIANKYLAAAGSARRCTHKSWADLGIDRVAEPEIGVERMATVKKRGKHDRRTALVNRIRSTRILENELHQTEEEIMATNPTHQAKRGIRPRSKLDFKARLLRQHFPDLPSIEGWSANLHFVDTSTPGLVKIATKDGGHIEIKNRMAKVYGQRGLADKLAVEIEGIGGIEGVEFLEELKTIQRRGSGLRQRRKPGEVPSLPADRVESLADRWRSRGYHKITEAPDGVWIEIGKCRIQDLGDELRIHGPAANDAAVRAMVEKATAEWGSEMEVYGEKAFKDSVWLEAQRQGVAVYDSETGQLYEPSADVKKAFETDLSRRKAQDDEIGTLRNHKAMAALVLEAAAGDKAALTKLETNDKQLADFITLHLDDEQRGKLVGKPEADVVAALPQFRTYGKTAREREDEEKKTRPAPNYALTPEEEAELEAEAVNDRRLEPK